LGSILYESDKRFEEKRNTGDPKTSVSRFSCHCIIQYRTKV
jgi:hypothetical protein